MLRAVVLLVACAAATADPEDLRERLDPHGHQRQNYPGRPLKLVDISRLSKGHNEHESIEERIAKQVLGPVYVTPQDIIDYRYLRKDGRAYKQGFGGQILILPYKPTPGDYQHVFDHLLQELRAREIAEEREHRHLGQRNEHEIETNPIRIIRPDHEVRPNHEIRPHHEPRPILELGPEHRPRHEQRPHHEPRPILELRPEHGPHNEPRPIFELRPEHERKPLEPRLQWPSLEHKKIYEQRREYLLQKEREERREQELRNERPHFEPVRPHYEPAKPMFEQARPLELRSRHEPQKPHHVPWAI